MLCGERASVCEVCFCVFSPSLEGGAGKRERPIHARVKEACCLLLVRASCLKSMHCLGEVLFTLNVAFAEGAMVLNTSDSL